MGKAEKLFNGAQGLTLYARITPSEEQRNYLQAKWNEVAEQLKTRLSEQSGFAVSTWLQGSYKYGTLIKPVHIREEYDVDVGVYFEWNQDVQGTPAPKQLREWVQRELLSCKRTIPELSRIEEPPKERCSRAIYERHFHIDTPVYHLDRDRDRRRLACLSGKWEASDPKSLYKWFKSAVGEDNRDQLRRMVRYLKAWAAVAFCDTPGSRPSSILLTVLAAQEYSSAIFWKLTTVDDDDMLAELARRIYGRLQAERRVVSPVDRSEDLNRIDDEHWDGFLSTLHALCECARRAQEAQDEAAAALIWSEAFSFLFPLPDAEEVEIVEEQSGRALMQLPVIAVDVFSRNPRSLIGSFVNEVPRVSKGCDLEFRITNPQVIPQYAEIEWTVRNTDDEADELGDLGHRRSGIRMLSAEERAAYAGTHYMDCVVRVSGGVYAVRRVPVTVADVTHPARHRPKPAYTKLRSRFGRRK